MASDESSSASGMIHLVDAARLEGYLAGQESGQIEGRRNGRTSAFLAAAKLVEQENALNKPDFFAVVETLKNCARW